VAGNTGRMGIRERLLIDLDLDAWPIGGRITSDDNPGRPFHGWLELSSAIEQRRTAAMTAEPARASGTAPSSGTNLCRKVARWLGKRTEPRWLLFVAWACAAWSALAVPAVAAAGSAAILPWWALGLVAIAVLLVFVWTEQGTAIESDHPGPPPAADPPAPPPDDGATGIDWSLLEREMSSETGDEADRPLLPDSPPCGRAGSDGPTALFVSNDIGSGAFRRRRTGHVTA
jgi:hypothetical protein